MYLHIVPDNTFINKFYENLLELSVLDRNKIVVRSNDTELKAIKYSLPFAPIYSRKFESIVGDTAKYEKVFIHYLTPLLYRFVATHNFRELSWMIWGGDLYNLPSLDKLCYEPITLSKYVRNDWSMQTRLYQLKVFLTQQPFAAKAYSKVRNILTWMDQEYRFALERLPVKAKFKFFFYENQLPYAKLDSLVVNKTVPGKLSLIVGNSGSPTNNHLDVVRFLEDNKVKADILLPVSYGDVRYISFLKKRITFTQGQVEFVDRYMPFDEYLNFLMSSDGLIMNTIRPQGYGNILMMMYLGKPIFFNTKNISLPDLDAAGLKWMPIESLRFFERTTVQNKEAVAKLLSHDRLLKEYSELFS